MLSEAIVRQKVGLMVTFPTNMVGVRMLQMLILRSLRREDALASPTPRVATSRSAMRLQGGIATKVPITQLTFITRTTLRNVWA